MDNLLSTYSKHADRQRTLILKTAEKLFIAKGIDKVSITAIAKECCLMRATIYHYFESKESILFQIYAEYMGLFNEKMNASLSSEAITTYKKIEVYLDTLLDMYVNNSDYYIFHDYFVNQIRNSYTEDEYVLTIKKETGYKSGSFMSWFMDNFHDGSIDPSLDPMTVSAHLCYGAVGILNYYKKVTLHLEAQYQLDTVTLIQDTFKSWLVSMKRKD